VNHPSLDVKSEDIIEIVWVASICVGVLRPKYGGMLRWLKKSSKETCLTWSHIHEKSRWLNFKMAQNLDHVSFYWDGSGFNDWKSEQSRFLMPMTSRETSLLRWLFDPSHHTPGPYPPYLLMNDFLQTLNNIAIYNQKWSFLVICHHNIWYTTYKIDILQEKSWLLSANLLQHPKNDFQNDAEDGVLANQNLAAILNSPLLLHVFFSDQGQSGDGSD